MIDYIVWLNEQKYNIDIFNANVKYIRLHKNTHNKLRKEKLPDVDTVLELIENDWTLEQIGNKYNVTRSAVSAYLKRNSIVLIKDRLPLKPIGCDECIVKPFCKGLCQNCYSRMRRRKREKRKKGF